MVVRHIFSAGNAVDLHVGVVCEVLQQLGSDEKILRGVLCTCNVDDARVNQTAMC